MNPKINFESDEVYRLIFQKSRDAIAMVKDGVHIRANPAFVRLLGYEMESEVVGKHIADLLVPEEVERALSYVADMAEGKAAPEFFKTIGVRKDGERFIGEVNPSPYILDGSMYLFVIIRDITDEEMASSLDGVKQDISSFLSESSKLMDSLEFILKKCLALQYLDAGIIYLIDEDKKTVKPAVYKGISPEFVKEVEKKWNDGDFFSLLISGSPIYIKINDILDENENPVLKQEELKSLAVLPIKYQGKTISSFNVASRNYDALPEVIKSGLVSIADQIGRSIARISAEEDCRLLEQKYRTLFDNSTEIICIIQDEKIAFCNSVTSLKTGYLMDELVGKRLSDFIEPYDKIMAIQDYLKILGGEKVEPRTYSFKKSDGGKIIGKVTGRPIEWEKSPAVLIQASDITREMELESQLHKSQRMEALGTLAGGIAHDFNNLLMALQGNTSLVLLEKEKGSSDHKRLTIMQDTIKDATAITRQLLGFAKGAEMAKTPVDFSEIIKKTINMLAPTRKDVVFELDAPEKSTVEIDISQMEQVLANLIINSFQAMPNGGRISISMDACSFQDSMARPANLAPGKYVKTTFSDNGCGIAPDNMEKIFDPFFSTKDKSGGSGLGLSSSYWIVSRHSGALVVKSEVKNGAAFEIYLPESDKAFERGDALSADIIKGQGTILVIDDEVNVLETLEDMLNILGYETLSESDPFKAIDYYQNSFSEIDLVVLDFLMPTMNGEKVFYKLKEINKDAKIMICSGYGMDEKNMTIAGRIDGVINKPIDIVDLSQKVDAVLKS